MAKGILWRTLPLTLAAALVLGGCDDEEEEKAPEVVVTVERGTEVTVKHKGEDEMIIVGELALFTTVIIWALFGAGATRRRDEALSENG